jgi:mono/diheme cytochrome c family protein
MPKPLPPLNAAWRLFGSKNRGADQALQVTAREFGYCIGRRTGMKMVLPAQLIPAAVISLLVLFPPHCTLAADVTRGKTIAQRWCSSCHLVAAEQTRAVADVPSFAAVARAKLPADSLKAFLSDPHPKMPDMSLTRSEIEDIVAYIQSLGR